MPIEYEITDLNAVGEELRGAYEQAEGGKYKLNLDKFAELQKAPLAAKNKQLLDEKKKLSQSLKAGQTIEEQNAELRKEIRHFKLTLPLRDLIGKCGIFPDMADVALLAAQKYFTLDEGGDLVVIDEHGDPTDISPKKFFDVVFKERHPRLYEASKAGGGGAGNNKKGGGFGGGKTVNRAIFEEMTPAERAAFFTNGGNLIDD